MPTPLVIYEGLFTNSLRDLFDNFLFNVLSFEGFNGNFNNNVGLKPSDDLVRLLPVCAFADVAFPR